VFISFVLFLACSWILWLLRWLSGKSWDQIIPEQERHKIEEEELHQQLVALNPPPRSRKTVNKTAEQADDRLRSNDDDDEDSESTPRKKGRPRVVNEVKGFTNNELKRFLKSIKKFGRPLERLVMSVS